MNLRHSDVKKIAYIELLFRFFAGIKSKEISLLFSVFETAFIYHRSSFSVPSLNTHFSSSSSVVIRTSTLAFSPTKGISLFAFLSDAYRGCSPANCIRSWYCFCSTAFGEITNLNSLKRVFFLGKRRSWDREQRCRNSRRCFVDIDDVREIFVSIFVVNEFHFHRVEMKNPKNMLQTTKKRCVFTKCMDRLSENYD